MKVGRPKNRDTGDDLKKMEGKNKNGLKRKADKVNLENDDDGKKRKRSQQTGKNGARSGSVLKRTNVKVSDVRPTAKRVKTENKMEEEPWKWLVYQLSVYQSIISNFILK